MADMAAQVSQILKLSLLQGKQLDDIVARLGRVEAKIDEIADAVTNEEATTLEIQTGTPTEQP